MSPTPHDNEKPKNRFGSQPTMPGQKPPIEANVSSTPAPRQAARPSSAPPPVPNPTSVGGRFTQQPVPTSTPIVDKSSTSPTTTAASRKTNPSVYLGLAAVVLVIAFGGFIKSRIVPVRDPIVIDPPPITHYDTAGNGGTQGSGVTTPTPPVTPPSPPVVTPEPAVTPPPAASPSLVGRWDVTRSGENHQVAGYMRFNSDGTFTSTLAFLATQSGQWEKKSESYVELDFPIFGIHNKAEWKAVISGSTLNLSNDQLKQDLDFKRSD